MSAKKNKLSQLGACQFQAVYLSLLLAILLFASSTQAGPVVLPDGAPRKLALLVGVGRFSDPGWPLLRFSTADAETLSDQLTSAGGFLVTRLTSPEQTTREAVLASLGVLRDSNQNPDDTVVVYLSTHGTLSLDLTGALRQVLVLADTRQENPLQSGLALSELVRLFEQLPSRRKVLILATCYSGAGKSSLSDAVQAYLRGLKSGPLQPLYEVSRASVILSASAWGEPAREDDGLGHDIYTHFLVRALQGYDPDGDGATSVMEAHDFARRETYAFTRGAQRPTALLSIEGEDPIILAGQRRGRGIPVLAAYEPVLDGYSILVDGQPKGSLPGGIAVSPGSHEVVLERPGSKAAGNAEELHLKVDAREGERIDLVQLYRQEPSHQLELHLGALILPPSERATAPAWTGAATVAVRQQHWPAHYLDLSAAVAVGGGRDTLQLNDVRVPVDLLALEGRLGLGTHFAMGPAQLHADLWAGCAAVSRWMQSSFYDSPRWSVSGLAAISLQARFRLDRSWSVGVGLDGRYLFGDLQGFGAGFNLVGAWSF